VKRSVLCRVFLRQWKKSSCKCCWYYSCTAIVKNMFLFFGSCIISRSYGEFVGLFMACFLILIYDALSCTQARPCIIGWYGQDCQEFGPDGRRRLWRFSSYLTEFAWAEREKKISLNASLFIFRLTQHYKWLYIHLFITLTTTCFGR
jgi:hypothetical protein